MPATYEAIATQTLGSAASTVTFSSIPATYTDLILVAVGKPTSASSLYMRFNSDTGNNYSYTMVYGNSAGTVSAYRLANIGVTTYAVWRTTNPQYAIVNIQNYADTSVSKSAITRSYDDDWTVREFANLWRSTSAINRIDLIGDSSYDTGCTFTLYGIKAA